MWKNSVCVPWKGREKPIDVSGRHNHPSLVAGASRIYDAFTKSIAFYFHDSAEQYAETGVQIDSINWSMCAWCTFRAPTVYEGHRSIFGARGASGDTLFWMGRIFGTLSCGLGKRFITDIGVSLDDDTAYHLALIGGGSPPIQLLLNGKVVWTHNDSVFSGIPGYACIGSLSAEYLFTGTIANYVLYRGTMSHATVHTLMDRRADLGGNIVGPRLTVPSAVVPTPDTPSLATLVTEASLIGGLRVEAGDVAGLVTGAAGMGGLLAEAGSME